MKNKISVIIPAYNAEKWIYDCVKSVLSQNDDNFEKTVDLLLTYFQNGGVHFQLTYVSKDDLMCAKETPDEYKHLRVRVTGFSDYFVKLNEAIQDDIIARTEQK